MSHSTVLVVLDGSIDESSIEDALAEALEPFDENKETPEYIRWTRAQLIENKRAEIITIRDGNYADYLADPVAYAAAASNPRHVKYLAEEFPKKLAILWDDDALYAEATEYDEGRLDSEGNLLSTYNPESKWDWYAIGGRWSGSVLNATETIHHEAVVHSPTWTDPAWDELGGGVDVVRKEDLMKREPTFAFLDKDGEWHEQGRMGWFGMASNEKSDGEWEYELNALVDKVDPHDWIVLVDVHI
jgi:hypothetical protein